MSHLQQPEELGCLPGTEQAFAATIPAAANAPAATAGGGRRRPSSERAHAKTTPVDLNREMTALTALRSDEQLKACEAVFDSCAETMGHGCNKVLLGALHLAFVDRHNLWQLIQDEDGNPVHQSAHDYGSAALHQRGVGASPSRVSRLLQWGAIGLDIHAKGMPLPESVEALRLLAEAGLDDAPQHWGILLSLHPHPKGPTPREIETYLDTLAPTPKPKKAVKQSPWVRVGKRATHGLALAKNRAPYDEIAAVFAAIQRIAERRGAEPEKEEQS
jgi:hypothetical protein